MEYKAVGVEGVKVLDEGKGIVELFPAVFNNIDHGKDRVNVGFFAESLAKKLPKGVLYHDWSRPIARTIEAAELGPGHPQLPEKLKGLGGLYIRGQCNLETVDGREAFSNMKAGILDEFSFGYEVEESKLDEQTGVRDLLKGRIYEWSPVLYGMNDMTAMVSAKSRSLSLDGMRLEELEELARGANEKLYRRWSGIAELEAKVGKPISAERRARIAKNEATLREVADDFRDLLKETAPEEGKANLQLAIMREFALYRGVL